MMMFDWFANENLAAAEADAAARRRLAGDRDVALHRDGGDQLDVAADVEHDEAVRGADRVAERSRAGVVEVGDVIDDAVRARRSPSCRSPARPGTRSRARGVPAVPVVPALPVVPPRRWCRRVPPRRSCRPRRRCAGRRAVFPPRPRRRRCRRAPAPAPRAAGAGGSRRARRSAGPALPVAAARSGGLTCRSSPPPEALPPVPVADLPPVAGGCRAARSRRAAAA